MRLQGGRGQIRWGLGGQSKGFSLIGACWEPPEGYRESWNVARSWGLNCAALWSKADVGGGHGWKGEGRRGCHGLAWLGLALSMER